MVTGRELRSPSRLAAGIDTGAALPPVNILRRPRTGVRLTIVRFLPLLALLMISALSCVWLQLEATDVAYRMSTVRVLVERLGGEQRDLQLEVAAAESPARLEELGRSLGLQPPKWGSEVPLP